MKLLLILPAFGLLWPAAPPSAATSAAPRAVQETASQVYERMTAEASAAHKAWRANVAKLRKAAQESSEPFPDEAKISPYVRLIPKFLAAADTYAGTEDAVPFLTWVVQNGFGVDDEQAKESFRKLVHVHVGSPQLEPLGAMLDRLSYQFKEKEAASLLATIEKNSPSGTLRAWAVYTRCSATLESAAIDSDEFLKAKSEVLAALEKADDRRLASRAKGQIDVRERFSIGVVAPDITGIDLDGTEFALSDYKGKVLFVDFWGDW